MVVASGRKKSSREFYHMKIERGNGRFGAYNCEKFHGKFTILYLDILV